MTDLDERSKHLRRLIVRGLAGGDCGHIGASMSLVEILRVLYDDVLRYRVDEPDWPDRDRLILSKGHGCLALYALLVDKGFIPTEALDTFCRKGGILGGHPDSNIPGVEWDTGSLGHGPSVGVGMALELRHQGSPARVFVVIGDGESQEGSVWEAAADASKERLSNFTVIVDYNKLQSAGPSSPLLEPIVDKWRAFGFACHTPIDGHDPEVLRNALPWQWSDGPKCIICNTVKGKGLAFAENDPLWHYRPQIGPELVVQMNEALA